MTRISIAMATYNGEPFIREQLNSFAAQSQLPEQLIVCDDGSNDRTVAIVEEFAASAPFPVTITRNPKRLGYSDNFARVISLCDGDVIFLSDQDDVWFPEKIATALEAFDAHPDAQVVINNQILTDEKLRHHGLTKLGNLRRVGKTSDAMLEGCSTALRREWAEMLFPMPPLGHELVKLGAMSHDRWLNELAILVGRRIVIQRPLQYFRRTGANATAWILSEPRQPTFRDLARERQGSAPVDAWRRQIDVLDAYECFLADHPLPGDNDAAFGKIAHQRSSIEQRIRLSGLPRWRRPWPIWRLWRSGSYRYFEGWMSAANDLVRPR
jgi:glycosyltransferase involved in cell wall biosynthesis